MQFSFFSHFFLTAKTGTQIIVPFRGVDEDVRHLRVMGDLGQIVFLVSFLPVDSL